MLSRQRAHVEVNLLFGRVSEDGRAQKVSPIAIDERMLQVLERTDDPWGELPVSSVALLAAAIEAQPAVGQILTESGVSVSMLERPQLLPVSDMVAVDHRFDLGAELESWFTDFGEGDGFTASYRRVQEKGRLTIESALTSCVESKYLGLAYFPSFHGLVEELARSAGLVLGANSTDGTGKPTYKHEDVARLCDALLSNLKDLEDVDPSVGQQQFILFHNGAKYCLRPFGAIGTYRLQEPKLPDGSLWIARANVLQAPRRFSNEAISELEALINSGAKEADFQFFFEEHSEFLLALGDYGTVHSQVVIHEDTGSRMIPDFFLEKLDSGLADICDLKRSNAELVRVQRRRTRFRSAVLEAVAQLEYYRDWFEEREHRDAFRSRYGFSAYRPRVVAIIGRRQSYEDDIQRIQLESSLPSWVRLATYDDVVLRARSWRELVK